MRSAAGHDIAKNTASASLEAVDIGLGLEMVANMVMMEIVDMEYWAVRIESKVQWSVETLAGAEEVDRGSKQLCRHL